MATADSSTDTRAFVLVDVLPASSPKLDDLAYLANAYKALQSLAMSHDGDDSPVALVLFQLNKQFEFYLDQVNQAGLLS